MRPSRDDPKRVVPPAVAATSEKTVFPQRPNPPPPNRAKRRKLRSLPVLRAHDCTGCVELGPDGAAAKDPAVPSNGHSTPLSERFIDAPWESKDLQALVLQLRLTREDAALDAATRVPSTRKHLRRVSADRYFAEVTGRADVIDARELEQLTVRGIETKETEDWRVLDFLNARGAQAVLVNTVPGAPPALVVFPRTFGTQIIERRAETLAVYSDGQLKPARGTDPLEPWVSHLGAALVAGAILEWIAPVIHPLHRMLDFTLRVPAFVIVIAIVFAVLEARKRR